MVLGTIYVFTIYYWPVGIAKKYANDHGIARLTAASISPTVLLFPS